MWREKENCEIFRAVPEMSVVDSQIVRANDCGDGNYVMELIDTTLEEYNSYLNHLSKNGFVKHIDNGLDGLENCVWSTTYTKDNLVVTVAHGKCIV